MVNNELITQTHQLKHEDGVVMGKCTVLVYGAPNKEIPVSLIVVNILNTYFVKMNELTYTEYI